MNTMSGSTQALSLRYGKQAIPSVGPWSKTIDGLLSHRSVRRYKSTLLEPGTLETLIAAAQSASTSSNLQCWSVISVTDPEMRSEFSQIADAQKHIEQCPLFLVWLCDLSRNRRLGQAHNAELTALDLTESFLVGVVDAALAAQNAVVAAESLGLSTVYIGALRNDAERVAEMLKLPPSVFAVFGMCIGYADTETEVKPRLPQPAVLFENHYATPNELELLEGYDQTLAQFSKRHGMALDSWSARVISRTRNKSSVGKRAELKQTLEALGFRLL